MTANFAETTLAQLAAERPQRTRVFEKLGLDYCCRGGRTLAESCQERRLDVGDVCDRLEEIDQAQNECVAASDWNTAQLAELIDHIVGVHHRYLRAEMPRLARLFERVAAAHGARHSELAEAQTVFNDLRDELLSHMGKEEQVLFPWIVLLESREAAQAPFGSVNNPIRCMEHEHRDAGEALERLRTLTNGYRTPADACASYRDLLQGLSTLEEDLHRHIHKENNILFPRAVALENS